MEERTTPLRHRDLAAYLRREYDPDTEFGYLLADAWNTVDHRPARPRENGGVVRAFVTVLRGLVPWSGTEAIVAVEGVSPGRSTERGVRDGLAHE